jgi:hypothetical protein
MTPGLLPPSSDSASMVRSAPSRKANTIANRWTFLTMRRPPISTKGSIDAVPTHQLAVWLMVSAVRATAKATGLNTCLPFILRMYFEAMAHTPAHSRNHRSCVDCAGVMMSARIRAEI